MVLVTYKPINVIVLAGLIVMVRHFLQAGRTCATLPGSEESMTTTIEFITALFYEVDEPLGAIPTHPEAHLWPSEVVTLGLLHACIGIPNALFATAAARQGDASRMFPPHSLVNFFSCILN